MKNIFSGIISGFIASITCFLPVVLVIFGILGTGTALYYGNMLFYNFWFVFLMLGAGIVFVFSYISFKSKHKVCVRDIFKNDDFKRLFFKSLLVFLISYFIFEIIWEIFWVKLGFYNN